MIEAHEDPKAVFAERAYAVEQARKRAELRKSQAYNSTGTTTEVQAPSEEAQLAIVTVPAKAPEPPPDPETYLRKARLSVVVCIVLGLMLAWIVQRRNGSAR